MKVLVTRPIPEIGVTRLRDAGHEVIVREEDSPIPREELLRLLDGCEAAVTMLTERIDEDLLAQHEQLRVVANFAVGFDNIDVPAATKHNVAVTNTPDVLTDATADLAWALMLAAARRVVEGDAYVRSGEWTGWGPLQMRGFHITGKTLGIVGPGRIGGAMGKRAGGFGMKVLYAGNARRPEFESQTGGEMVSLEELLAKSDFVSLHCPLTPKTRHLLGAEQFKLMKSTAVLVNTARGAVIDENALVDALRSGEIGAAGLDVFEQEPKIHSGLFELKNVVMLPHLGSATHQTRDVMAELCAENILAIDRGDWPKTILNPDVLETQI
ncbi:D-glycerate dehydrogenase [bacterium]|nr:D-glycerate dehydrogenase [bacterium]